MEIRFSYLDLEETKKEEEESKREIEIRKIWCELLTELAKLGNKKVTTKIVDYTKEFLNKKEIKYGGVYYQNDNKKYNCGKYLERTLVITFKNYYGYNNYIRIVDNWQSKIDEKTGTYANLIKQNKWADKENVEKYEKDIKQKYKNIYTNMETYNKKLKELEALKELFM